MFKVEFFSKHLYDTARARSCLNKHKFFPMKRVHETTQFLRYRIREPDYDRYEYRTKQISQGIKMIIAVPFYELY